MHAVCRWNAFLIFAVKPVSRLFFFEKKPSLIIVLKFDTPPP